MFTAQNRNQSAASRQLRARLEAIPPIHAVCAVDQFLIWSENVLRFVTPAVEATAAFLFGGLGIRISGDIDRLAAEVHAGRLRTGVRFVERASVAHWFLRDMDAGMGGRGRPEHSHGNCALSNHGLQTTPNKRWQKLGDICFECRGR